MASVVILLAIVAVSFLVALILRVAVVAPYKLFLSERSQKESLQVELDALNANEPDFPLGEAIEHIQTTKGDWKETHPNEVRKAIEQLALDGKIVTWGKMGSDKLVKIPSQFFFDVDGGPHEDKGYFLESFGNFPGWSDSKDYKRVYQVTVNRNQINAIFATKKPTKQ